MADLLVDDGSSRSRSHRFGTGPDQLRAECILAWAISTMSFINDVPVRKPPGTEVELISIGIHLCIWSAAGRPTR